ncbi:hypothetical protein DFJ43DRAFT_1038699 [Lentinula guzmanii]|uniref:Uncharacterized protein n=1 Tax=Lentinula guzmanii TaxID=2804957 RepID=A0AA38JI14_9AGAR|nr:hypothetical protein DFJ43DRAFT_1038699 [Lentinula guzmanii]
MPRSRQVSHQATVSFMVKAYRISKTNFTSPLSIVTTASHPPRRHDVHRLPLVEHGFSGWPVPQAYIHDCKLNTTNVVNTQAGDPLLLTLLAFSRVDGGCRRSFILYSLNQWRIYDTIESHSNNDFLLGNQHLIIISLHGLLIGYFVFYKAGLGTATLIFGVLSLCYWPAVNFEVIKSARSGPSPRKRGLEGDNEISNSSTLPQSYDRPDKTRAIAGPGRKAFDAEINARRSIQRRLDDAVKQNQALSQVNAALEAQHAEIAMSETLDGNADKDQMIIGEQDDMIASLNRRAMEAEEKNAQMSRATAKLRSDFEDMRRKLGIALQEQENAARTCEELTKSRDEALQTKEQQQAEINTLRNRNRTSQRHSSTQQSFQQPSHQTPQRPSPQRAPRDADEDMENDGGASSTRQAPDIDINAVIQAAVTQALSAFQAANPQSPRTPRSSHRKNQMPKEGSVAHRRQLKKAGLDALKPDVEQAWRDRKKSPNFETTPPLTTL